MSNLPDTKNRRILIIDDNHSIHDDFRKILAPASISITAVEQSENVLFGQQIDGAGRIQYEIDSAYQGQEGVARVKQAFEKGSSYAMAFVDLQMPPGFDGVETSQRILEIDPAIQIVICTAYGNYSWDELFKKIGHRDGLLILKKPFDAMEVLQLAHALTEKWRLHRQSLRQIEELESRVTQRAGELQQVNHALEMEVVKYKQAEEELRWKTALFEAQVNSSIDGILIVDQDGRMSLQNQRFIDLFKVPSHIANEKSDKNRLQWVASMIKSPESFLQKVHHLYAHPNEINHDEIELKDGTTLDRYSFPAVGRDGKYYGRVWSFRDITERKNLEAQLFQSQKMEIVGKLAGGIAHEFNSILTAIIGQSEFILSDLPFENPIAKNAIEIHLAADRAVKLTRQLLAYGRKQILQPVSLDLNLVLADMEGTLQHLLGRNVDVRIVPGAGLKAVRMDPDQMEQVIVNIAMNAAAAMPGGGKFTVETANVTLDQGYVGHFSDLKPGEYVMLAMTDTGTGISPEAVKHIFEPFFTIKAAGQGSGLSLATCYGILKQSGGHINVYSELSRGTTFKIYLPQFEAEPKIPASHPNAAHLPRGTETILLVEDDPALREMASMLLARLGYTVFTAADGLEALNLKRQRGVGHLDLVFTDVVMPHMSGKELSDRFRALYPQTKILFTSAYTENAILHQGVLAPSMTLLQKPFTPAALACKVREMLDQPGL